MGRQSPAGDTKHAAGNYFQVMLNQDCVPVKTMKLYFPMLRDVMGKKIQHLLMAVGSLTMDDDRKPVCFGNIQLFANQSMLPFDVLCRQSEAKFSSGNHRLMAQEPLEAAEVTKLGRGSWMHIKHKLYLVFVQEVFMLVPFI